MIDRKTAAAKLLERRKICANLGDYAQLALGLQPAKHHRAIIAALEAVSRGEVKRLMIFAPPGSAKSSYVSRIFPAWYLANHPGHNVLFASHTTIFSDKWGRLVRNDIAEHANTLNLKLAEDTRAQGRWGLTNRSEFLAVGAGSAVTGYRADLVLLDDIVKGAEDADSELERAKLQQWLKSDVITRLKPGGAVVLIMTRWRVNDIAGTLLEEQEQGGEKWVVLNLPAEAEQDDVLGREPGQLLWDDDSFGYAKHLDLMKRSQSARDWQALYQQRPVALGGNFFNESWLVPYDKLPPREGLRFYGGTDFAVTEKGDWTVLLVVAIDRDENIYLVDCWRKRTTPAEWVDALLDLHRGGAVCSGAWKKVRLPPPSGRSLKSVPESAGSIRTWYPSPRAQISLRGQGPYKATCPTGA